MATLDCQRCGKVAEPLERPPMPGMLGRLVQERICASCWREWEAAEVMVINELRLNFMDPEAQAVLEGHMREFLALDPVKE